MNTAAVHSPSAASTPSPRTARIFGTAALMAIALAFVVRYVFRYYGNYNQAAFTDPVRGAANYWALRGWLLLHITGGMVALLLGPLQFWSGYRARFYRLHRWTGRLFLLGVATGSVGAFRMAAVTTFGWAFGVTLMALGFAWITTAGMAYYAILHRQVQIHREWMVRTYVVTFGFVIFRVLADYSPLSRLEPIGDRFVISGWLCWTLPLLVAGVWIQMRNLRRQARA